MARKEDGMTNWILTLTLDWNSGSGRFSTKTWTKVTDGTSGPPVADFVAADVQQNDTISFSVQSVREGNPPQPQAVNLHQLVVIFTKQPGAGSEACSPINWTDPQGYVGPPGMVIFAPPQTQSQPNGAPLPWSSGPTTYPPNVPLTIAVTGPNAYESTVCAEIWDDHQPPYIRFYTHDPDMDVTS
jgi:hypothetical protein